MKSERGCLRGTISLDGFNDGIDPSFAFFCTLRLLKANIVVLSALEGHIANLKFL